MIKTNIKLPIDYKSSDVLDSITNALPVDRSEIKSYKFIKRSLNLSDKKKIHYDLTVAIEFSPEREAGLLKMRKKVFSYTEEHLERITSKLPSRPVVVGAGPSGLFAALMLAECGACPILIERGLPVEERQKKVSTFAAIGVLDPECNVQFGEGGAGTYSDGKLKVGSMDKYKMRVLSEFVECGADEDILYSTTAHVGTDRLSDIVKKIREKIIFHGGEVLFSARLTDIVIKSGQIRGVRIENNGDSQTIETDAVILAAGHSARDTFQLLEKAGAHLTPRGFGIGLRIEHSREYINTLVYGKGYDRSLESASYHLVTHLPTGRNVYSFCMCPGGSVVPAASEAYGIVTNGMSEYKRDGDNSNAAFLVSVTPADFGAEGPLAGLDLQRKIERRAFGLTDSYRAPSQEMGEFMTGEKSTNCSIVLPSYPIGTEPFRAEDYLPGFITDSLRAAIPDFDAWMPGFYCPDAVMTGPETRSTSPVRVERDEKFEAVGISGLYPCGEGAGYSGGIVSSARDGLMAAEALLLKYN